MSTKRKDGRLQGSIVLTNPITLKKKRVYYYGKTPEQLAAARAEIIDAFDRHFISGSKLFADFVVDFLSMKRDDEQLEETTITTYRQQINNNILPYLPDKTEVAEISPEMCKYILAQLPTAAAKKYIYGLLHSIFKEAKFRQLIVNNPIEYVHPPKHTQQAAGIITPEIFHTLIDAVRGSMWEYLFKVAIATGLRRGELCGLHWTDINFTASTISVTRALKNLSGTLHEGKPKTPSSVRTIAIDAETATVLKDWRRVLSAALAEKNLPFELDGYVWRSPVNLLSPLHPATVTQKIERLKRSSPDIPPGTRFHSFRHTHATLLAAGDLSAKKIQARLGHAQVAFTLDRYVHNVAALNDGVTDVIEKAAKAYH